MNIDRDQYYKMIATAYSFLVNFTKKNYDKLCFPRNKKKKLSVRHPQNDHFGDFETEAETLFGNRQFFFSN